MNLADRIDPNQIGPFSPGDRCPAEDGDADDDGDVNGMEFLVWQRNFTVPLR